MTGKNNFLRMLYPVVLISLMGCSAMANISKLPEEQVTLDVQQEVMPVPYQPPLEKQSEGSLWQANGTMSSLFVDYKARSVGDIVTILVVEAILWFMGGLVLDGGAMQELVIFLSFIFNMAWLTTGISVPRQRPAAKSD